MVYIHPKNRDTRYDLWFVRYQCRVPFIQTLSVEDLEENGMPTSGDMHHDHATHWEPRLLSLPIHRMAELWSAGANIALVNRTDAPKIFEAISKHLHAWKNHIAESYHPNKPPYDDLLMLDQFANVVYEHARFAYDQTFIQTHFKISSSTAIGRRAMLSNMAKIDQRRIEDAESGELRVRNIDFRMAAPKYDPDSKRNFVDYAGKNKEINAPVRNSMAQFFQKGKK